MKRTVELSVLTCVDLTVNWWVWTLVFSTIVWDCCVGLLCVKSNTVLFV
jgi:hypothetical protein